MPNVEDFYPSEFNHLKADDLKGRSHKLTIESIDSASFDDGKKLVLHFEGREKTLVLNKTNARVIAKYHGQDFSKWVGKQIEIFPTDVEFQGKLVPAIRVRVEQDAGEDQDVPW